MVFGWVTVCCVFHSLGQWKRLQMPWPLMGLSCKTRHWKFADQRITLQSQESVVSHVVCSTGLLELFLPLTLFYHTVCVCVCVCVQICSPSISLEWFPLSFLMGPGRFSVAVCPLTWVMTRSVLSQCHEMIVKRCMLQFNVVVVTR